MRATPTQSAVAWSAPPDVLELKHREIHVWRASLDLVTARVQSLFSTLAEDERQKAHRLFHQQSRERRIVSRGLLRAILGRYLAMEPHELRFCYGPYGKPALSPESGGATLGFNVSHSSGLALYAVTRGQEIGVDIERVRPGLDFERTANRFFSAGEVAALRAQPADRRHEAFFACWTGKEAYIKASGKGLSVPLDQFEVSFVAGEPIGLSSITGDPDTASRWSLHRLYPGPGYVATLAVERHHGILRCWQWPEQ